MKINELIFGAPLDPFGKDTKRHIAIICSLAWIGLGAGWPLILLWTRGGIP